MGSKRRRNVAKKPKARAGNPWLPPELQGRDFRVKAVMIVPEVIVLDSNGLEERRVTPQQLAWYESAWGLSIQDFLARNGLNVKGNSNG